MSISIGMNNLIKNIQAIHLKTKQNQVSILFHLDLQAIEDKNEVPISPPQSTYKKTKADENNVAPIIYFRINYDFVKNPFKLEKTIIDALKHSNITLKAIKVTQNGNLLVYPGSNVDKQAIIKNQLLFPECKWCDLETSKKKFQLMVKGINAENFSLRYNSGISQEYKIDNIIEIRKKDGTILNICKIEMESKDDFERLLQEETIKLGLFNYKVERIHKSPIRCHNCKEFGHTIKTCNKEGKCGKCGKTSHEDECETNELKCINCGENHSCYFKGCPKYKDLMKVEIEKLYEVKRVKKMSDTNNRGVPEGFKRNYSAMTNSLNTVNISNIIQNELKSFMVNMTKQLTDFTNTINTNMSTLKNDLEKSIGKQIQENNNKLSYFFIDMIKLMIPNCQKPDEKIAHAISNRFNNHHLGNLSSKTLIEYINKLWK